MTISETLFEERDIPLLIENAGADGTDADELLTFANASGSVITTYGNDSGPLLLLRGRKSLRLDVALPALQDMEPIALLLVEAVRRVAERARTNGFTELLID